jgi:hypothetical protein
MLVSPGIFFVLRDQSQASLRRVYQSRLLLSKLEYSMYRNIFIVQFLSRIPRPVIYGPERVVSK